MLSTQPSDASARPGSLRLTEREPRDPGVRASWWKYAGDQGAGDPRRVRLSATRYYQVLNALIDREAALAYDPLLVKRLRRMRATRRRTRSARRLDADA